MSEEEEDRVSKRQKTTSTTFSVNKKLRQILKRNRPRKNKAQWENVSLKDVSLKLEQLLDQLDTHQLQTYVKEIPVEYLNKKFESSTDQPELQPTLLLRYIDAHEGTGTRYHQLILLLLNRNRIDLDTQGKFDETALHIVCIQESISLEVIEMLLVKGANPNVFNHSNRTALDYLFAESSTVRFGYTEFEAVKLLVKKITMWPRT